MKIKILKVSKHSAHYGASYNLYGVVGEMAEFTRKRDGTVFLSLVNCEFPVEFPESGLTNGQFVNAFVDEYEVVEE